MTYYPHMPGMTGLTFLGQATLDAMLENPRPRATFLGNIARNALLVLRPPSRSPTP